MNADEPLNNHLDAFELHCKTKRLSKYTIQSYKYQIQSFVDFASVQGVTLLKDVDKLLVEVFLTELQETNSGTSCRDYYKGIRRFFNWLEEEGVIERNPMGKMRPPKEDTKLVQPFTESQIRQMEKICNSKTLFGIRNLAIINVFYDTAVRLREMAEMLVDDIDIDQETIRVMGKNNTERLVMISGKTLKLIYQYLKNRPQQSDYLWLNEHGRPLTRDGIYQIISGIKKKAGIEGVRCSPHTFRHTRATDLLRKGVDRKFVQIMLGHSDPRMTDRYVKTLDSIDAIDKIKEKDVRKGR